MVCASCGGPIIGKKRGARFCSVNCRDRAAKARQKGVPELRPAAQVVDSPPPSGGLRAATLERLEAVNRAGSPEGMLALALAERIDAKADTAAGLAAAAKQFHATFTEALRGADTGDLLDELAARRAERRGA